MSGIASVMLNQGYRVTGSDMVESDVTERLRETGVKVTIGHLSLIHISEPTRPY